MFHTCVTVGFSTVLVSPCRTSHGSRSAANSTSLALKASPLPNDIKDNTFTSTAKANPYSNTCFTYQRHKMNPSGTGEQYPTGHHHHHTPGMGMGDTTGMDTSAGYQQGGMGTGAYRRRGRSAQPRHHGSPAESAHPWAAGPASASSVAPLCFTHSIACERCISLPRGAVERIFCSIPSPAEACANRRVTRPDE